MFQPTHSVDSKETVHWLFSNSGQVLCEDCCSGTFSWARKLIGSQWCWYNIGKTYSHWQPAWGRCVYCIVPVIANKKSFSLPEAYFLGSNDLIKICKLSLNSFQRIVIDVMPFKKKRIQKISRNCRPVKLNICSRGTDGNGYKNRELIKHIEEWTLLRKNHMASVKASSILQKFNKHIEKRHLENTIYLNLQVFFP